VLWANHTETLLHAALSGAGIASIPATLVAPWLSRGELVRVLAPWNTGTLAIWAALPSRRFVPRRSRAFLDHAVAQAREAAAAARGSVAGGRTAT
jgi:DNA-binding transcriptional LysR family regulator